MVLMEAMGVAQWKGPGQTKHQEKAFAALGDGGRERESERESKRERTRERKKESESERERLPKLARVRRGGKDVKACERKRTAGWRWPGQVKAANHVGLEDLEYLRWLQKRSQWDEHNSISNDTRKETVHLEQQHRAQQLRKEGVRVRGRLVVRE